MDRTDLTEVKLEEPELYVEPPPMTRRDTFGIVAALAALAAIGILGYVWLNPALGFRPRQQPKPEPSVVSTAEADGPTSAEPESLPAGSIAGDPTDVISTYTLHTDDTSCPYCGMYADKSLSHVIVLWSDGSHTHHDSWDCVFGHERDTNLMLEQSTVISHGKAGEAPEWLDAFTAHYLYGTAEIAGSMPPYVAAFPDAAAAAAAAAELGGEALDFAGLRKQWSR